MAESPSWSARAQRPSNCTARNNWNGCDPSRCNGTRRQRRRERHATESGTIDQLPRCHRSSGTRGIDSTNRQLGNSVSMTPTFGRATRNTLPDPPKPGKAVLLLGVLASLSIGFVGGVDMSTAYLKPTMSSKDCVGSAGQIASKTETLGNDGACMQCDPAINVCPPGCQALIDEMYINCDGVTTPDGLYYDPNNAIEGEWSDNVKAAIKIATERCGCDLSTRTSQPGAVVGTVALTTMLSLGTWWFATSFF